MNDRSSSVTSKSLFWRSGVWGEIECSACVCLCVSCKAFLSSVYPEPLLTTLFIVTHRWDGRLITRDASAGICLCVRRGGP